MKRFAIVTLDFEKDYGHRVGDFNILKSYKQINFFTKLIKKYKLPISSFIVTKLLKNKRYTDLLHSFSSDYHAHSHTHDIFNYDSKYEIFESFYIFKKYFGYKPLGYRAPQGVLNYNDIDYLKSAGFLFSSSVFPSFRPFLFNNLSKSNLPFSYSNGIIEYPFAATNDKRLIISLSYIKLYGLNYLKKLLNQNSLPNILVLDTHLHDFIFNLISYKKLPLKYKILYRRNYKESFSLFLYLVNFLKKQRYNFITMSELHDRVENGDISV